MNQLPNSTSSMESTHARTPVNDWETNWKSLTSLGVRRGFVPNDKYTKRKLVQGQDLGVAKQQAWALIAAAAVSGEKTESLTSSGITFTVHLIEDTLGPFRITFSTNALPCDISIKDAMNLDGAPATATNDWEEAFERRFGVEKIKELLHQSPASRHGSTSTRTYSPIHHRPAMQELDLGPVTLPSTGPAPPLVAVPLSSST
ncbi:hypothetical protein BU15DRAFT_67798 [Melanogaster broomeanus]|nr:hypothetical protein BU15DRAFT_67798 [Melanogaster broomeanus]